MNKFHEIIDRITNATNIVLTTHERADADGISCELAVSRILRKHGKSVIIINPDPISPSFSFLDSECEINHDDKNNHAIINSSDLVIVLDAGEFKRLGELEKIIKSLNKKTVFIDHHEKGLEENLTGVFDSSASATAELIFELITEMQVELDSMTAKLLYAGLIYDTRSFRFIKNKPSSLIVGAELLSKGIDADYIQEQLFASKSKKRTELLGWVLSNMRFTCNDRLVLVAMNTSLLGRLQMDTEEVRSIINDLIEIRGVDVAIVLKEFKKNKIKISMRSKSSVTVSDIAIKNGGGGHLRAAGFDMDGNMEEIANKLVKEFERKLK